jgi:DNA-binding NarL/FixJ family response regulator
VQDKAPEQRPVTAILVSRPGVFQQALRASIHAHANIVVLASCGDGLSALQSLERHHPHLLIIDTNLLDEEVAALVSLTKSQHPETYCLVLQQTNHRAALALQAGADAAAHREEWALQLPSLMQQLRLPPTTGAHVDTQ